MHLRLNLTPRSPASPWFGSSKTRSRLKKKSGDLTAKGWEYDEYRLEMPLYDGLALDVAAAYDSYLAQARAEEESKNEFERMANSVASLQAAQSDTDSMVVEQEYRITMLELGVSDTDDTDKADNT